jgi:hypothetical protein
VTLLAAALHRIQPAFVRPREEGPEGESGG